MQIRSDASPNCLLMMHSAKRCSGFAILRPVSKKVRQVTEHTQTPRIVARYEWTATAACQWGRRWASPRRTPTQRSFPRAPVERRQAANRRPSCPKMSMLALISHVLTRLQSKQKKKRGRPIGSRNEPCAAEKKVLKTVALYVAMIAFGDEMSFFQPFSCPTCKQRYKTQPGLYVRLCVSVLVWRSLAAWRPDRQASSIT